MDFGDIYAKIKGDNFPNKGIRDRVYIFTSSLWDGIVGDTIVTNETLLLVPDLK